MFRGSQVAQGLDPRRNWIEQGKRLKRRRRTVAPPRAAEVAQPRRPPAVSEVGASIREGLR